MNFSGLDKLQSKRGESFPIPSSIQLSSFFQDQIAVIPHVDPQ